jgi:hypothetical protein
MMRPAPTLQLAFQMRTGVRHFDGPQRQGRRRVRRQGVPLRGGGWFGRVGLEGGKGMGGGRKCDERYFKAIAFFNIGKKAAVPRAS